MLNAYLENTLVYEPALCNGCGVCAQVCPHAAFEMDGRLAVLVGGLIAANSSTILTCLNWGASYLVHDFYQRFIRKDAAEKHHHPQPAAQMPHSFPPANADSPLVQPPP